MSIEDNVELFRKWAVSLGCPPASIPSEDALKSIFKSRQNDLFKNIMKRVQPKQYVQATRENIFIREMEKFKKHQLVVPSARHLLPKQTQIYLKWKNLSKKKNETEKQLSEYRAEYQELAKIIKAENISFIQAKEKLNKQTAKVNILELKLLSLEKQISDEEQNKQRIKATIPARLAVNSVTEDGAISAIKKALQELEGFYTLCNSEDNARALQEAKDDLWKQMRLIFAEMPNALLFNAILKLKEKQVEHVMNLSKSDSVSHSLSGNGCSENFSAFEWKMLETKISVIGHAARLNKACEERNDAQQKFCTIYEPFIEELQKQVNLYNAGTDKDVDEIIYDFIAQYTAYNFNKAQNEYLTEQIGLFKSEIQQKAKLLEDHEALVSSINQTYNDISASVNNIQHETLQLAQIKDKILYTKNMLKRIFEEQQLNAASKAAKFNLMHAKMLDVSSIFGMEGFDASKENVFCSTKLDLDSTLVNPTSADNTMQASFTKADNTLMPSVGGPAEGRIMLPPHTLELSTFIETPLENLSNISKDCAFYLSPNPFIIEARGLDSDVVKAAPYILLTPAAILRELRACIAWAESIAKQSSDVKFDLEITKANPVEYIRQIDQQRAGIIESLDKIDVLAVNTNHMLKKCARLYDFLLKNPLRHYVPDTKTYEEHTYAEYEAEFNMYYRMALKGDSMM